MQGPFWLRLVGTGPRRFAVTPFVVRHEIAYMTVKRSARFNANPQ
jgi:hypothetical protein